MEGWRERSKTVTSSFMGGTGINTVFIPGKPEKKHLVRFSGRSQARNRKRAKTSQREGTAAAVVIQMLGRGSQITDDLLFRLCGGASVFVAGEGEHVKKGVFVCLESLLAYSQHTTAGPSLPP